MQKTVIVTGASTGIGFDAVRILTENNFKVVATVRNQQDVDSLSQTFAEAVVPILLDVVDYSQVDQLPTLLKEKHKITEIFALVNNAGVGLAGPVMYQDFNEIQNMVSVNILGLIKMTQVVLPLMSEGGRIVNISSIAGKHTLPFLSVYAATKHAVEGLSKGLTNELNMLGIKVIVIGPGSIKTPIWDKGFKTIKDKYNHTVYAKSFNKFINMVVNKVDDALPVEEVSKNILSALTIKNPKNRYEPIPSKWLNLYLPMLLPRIFMDKLKIKMLHLKK